MKVSFHRLNNFDGVDGFDFADHFLDKEYIFNLAKPSLHRST